MVKELKALESLLQDKEFVQQLTNDKMLQITYNTLCNYVKNGHSLLDLPWFDLGKKVQFTDLAA